MLGCEHELEDVRSTLRGSASDSWGRSSCGSHRAICSSFEKGADASPVEGCHLSTSHVKTMLLGGLLLSSIFSQNANI